MYYYNVIPWTTCLLRARQNPVHLPGASEFLCGARRSPWQLACRASKVEPETLTMYTFSDFILWHFELIRRRLPFFIHSGKKDTQKKEIRASKNKLRASGPKPHLAPGTSWKFIFCHALFTTLFGKQNGFRLVSPMGIGASTPLPPQVVSTVSYYGRNWVRRSHSTHLIFGDFSSTLLCFQMGRQLSCKLGIQPCHNPRGKLWCSTERFL